MDSILVNYIGLEDELLEKIKAMPGINNEVD
jgi:hypothetical protein